MQSIEKPEVQITPRLRPKELEKRNWHLWTTGRWAEQRTDSVGDRVDVGTVRVDETFQEICVEAK